jgi:hypothetical protein
MTGLARGRCPASNIPFLGGGDLVAYPLSGAGKGIQLWCVFPRARGVNPQDPGDRPIHRCRLEPVGSFKLLLAQFPCSDLIHSHWGKPSLG